jgi:hypothetical protein
MRIQAFLIAAAVNLKRLAAAFASMPHVCFVHLAALVLTVVAMVATTLLGRHLGQRLG